MAAIDTIDTAAIESLGDYAPDEVIAAVDGVLSQGAGAVTYVELYHRWERQQWRTEDLDFGQDASDWRERGSGAQPRRRVLVLAPFFLRGEGVDSIHRRGPPPGPADLPDHPGRGGSPPRPFLRQVLRGGVGIYAADHRRPAGSGQGPAVRRLSGPLRSSADRRHRPHAPGRPQPGDICPRDRHLSPDDRGSGRAIRPASRPPVL